MATKESEPKETRQGGDGRKDERKGVDVGRDIDDRGDGEGNKTGSGGRNSAGGSWGTNKGNGGNDSHNKR